MVQLRFRKCIFPALWKTLSIIFNLKLRDLSGMYSSWKFPKARSQGGLVVKRVNYGQRCKSTVSVNFLLYETLQLILWICLRFAAESYTISHSGEKKANHHQTKHSKAHQSQWKLCCHDVWIYCELVISGLERYYHASTSKCTYIILIAIFVIPPCKSNADSFLLPPANMKCSVSRKYDPSS